MSDAASSPPPTGPPPAGGGPAEAQRRHLHDLFAEVPVLVASLHGPQHVVETANENFRRALGHRPLLGRPYREAAPELVGQGFFEQLDAVYRTGETHTGTEVPVYFEPGAPGPAYFNYFHQATHDATQAVDGILSPLT